MCPGELSGVLLQSSTSVWLVDEQNSPFHLLSLSPSPSMAPTFAHSIRPENSLSISTQMKRLFFQGILPQCQSRHRARACEVSPSSLWQWHVPCFSPPRSCWQTISCEEMDFISPKKGNRRPPCAIMTYGQHERQTHLKAITKYANAQP